ncbi:Fc.00g077800.m01.CDS01 [Cosmosporella sp. VM-42]
MGSRKSKGRKSKHKGGRPGSFAEWAVGLTIASAVQKTSEPSKPRKAIMPAPDVPIIPIIEEPDSEPEYESDLEAESEPEPEPKPRPRHRRRRFSVDLTTDDQTNEDVITFNIPRDSSPIKAKSRRPPAPPSERRKSVLKEVRFEPLKSAMKQTRLTTFQSDNSSDVSSESNLSPEDVENAYRQFKKEMKTNKYQSNSGTEGFQNFLNKYAKAYHDSQERGSNHRPSYNNRKGKRGKVAGSDASVSEASWSEVSESEADTPSKTRKQNSDKSNWKKERRNDTDTNTENSRSESDHSSKKPKKKGRETETDESASERDDPPRGKKKTTHPKHAKQSKHYKNKGGKKVEESETDEAPDSSDSDEDTKSKKKKKKSAKAKEEQRNRQKKKVSKKMAKNQHTESSAGESSSEEPAEEQPAKTKKKKKKKKKKMEKSRMTVAETDTDPPLSQYSDVKIMGPQQYHNPYPNGWPSATPRSPNYIQPIQAHVVQTERVVERPEDPAPNAYFDGQHNVLRVYHGPVYGNQGPKSLYQRRDARHKPIPPPLNLGQPHPTQNPYFNGWQGASYQQDGWQNAPHQQGFTYVPITQGVPPQAVPPQGMHPQTYWNPNYPPPGPLPGHYEKEASPVVASHRDKDKPGTNNVGPANSTSNNPYRVQPQSQFSAWGSNRQRNASGNTRNGQRDPSKETLKSAMRSNNNGWTNNEEPGNKNQDAAWPNTWNDGTAPPANDTWGTTNGPVNDTWGTNNEQQQWNNASRSRSRSLATHRTAASRDKVDHWAPWGTGGKDVEIETTFATHGDNTPVDPNFKPGTTWGPENNVMPGTWIETSGVINPPWGDPTAAADTGGEAVEW